MNREQQINDDVRFIETCVELQLLSDIDARSLQVAAAQTSGPVASEAVKRGLEDPLELPPGTPTLKLNASGSMGELRVTR